MDGKLEGSEAQHGNKYYVIVFRVVELLSAKANPDLRPDQTNFDSNKNFVKVCPTQPNLDTNRIKGKKYFKTLVFLLV